MNGMCDLCKKVAVLDCPDCDLEVCVDHSRSGKCIYCTHIGVKINKKAVKRIKAFDKLYNKIYKFEKKRDKMIRKINKKYPIIKRRLRKNE